MFNLILIMGAVMCLADGSQDGTKTGSVRVLLVTGMDHPAHDWQKTAPALRSILESDPRFKVAIVEDPEVLATELVFDYNLVVLHFRNDRPLHREKQMRDNLLRHVRDGGGLVVVHFACGAFGNWPQYRDLVGKVWDQKNTHDPRGPFAVHIVDTSHSITSRYEGFRGRR